MSQSRIPAFIAAVIVVVGFTSFPFVTFVVDGQRVETNPAMNGPAFIWICPLLVVITLFIGGKMRGWWWIGASVLGLGVLISAGLQSMAKITESANLGFIGVTFEDVLSGNTPPQTIENMTFGTGFYVLVLGLMVLVASGIWDIIQKKKQQTSHSAQVVPEPSNTRDDKSQVVAPVIQDKPAERLKKLKELLDSELITSQEYEAKKSEILAKM